MIIFGLAFRYKQQSMAIKLARLFVPLLMILAPLAQADEASDIFSRIKKWSLKLRPEVSALIAQQNVDTPEQAIALFHILKSEELTFLDLYINRTKLKRIMTADEIALTRSHYRLHNLTDDEVQTYYANEVKRLVIEAEQIVKLRLSEQALSYPLNEDTRLVEFLANNYNSTKKQNAANSVLEGLDISFPEWTKAEAENLTQLYQQNSEPAQRDLCCCVSAGGCLLCPFNRSLNRINKERGQ